jgi:hypothetical protein
MRILAIEIAKKPSYSEVWFTATQERETEEEKQRKQRVGRE